MKPKIILADDHYLFRDGIKTLIELDEIAEVIGEASNGVQLLELLKATKPDIVLTDIDMPVMGGIEATQKALELYPDLKIVALTMFGEESFYHEMINAGAKGFILKSSDKAELKEAINKVNQGHSYFSNELLQHLLANISKKEKQNPQHNDSRFTSREIEIIQQLALGLSTQEIADNIHLSVKTVENYRTKLLQKTNSKNATGLVVYAIKQGIIKL
ncbi:MAG: response regulator transcription factor [Bacteroidota bacterium]